MESKVSIEDVLAAALCKASARVIPLGLYQGYTLKGKYGNPDIDEGFVILIQCGFSDTANAAKKKEMIT